MELNRAQMAGTYLSRTKSPDYVIKATIKHHIRLKELHYWIPDMFEMDGKRFLKTKKKLTD